MGAASSLAPVRKSYIGTDCIECGRGPMKNRRHGKEPGEVYAGSGGRCEGCRTRKIWRDKHGTAGRIKSVHEDEHVRHNREMLDKYLAVRRVRLEQKGLRVY